MVKRKKKNFEFSNRVLYTLITIGILAIVGVGVYAWGTSVPSTVGHSAGELDLSGGVNGNAVFNGNAYLNARTHINNLTLSGFSIWFQNTGARTLLCYNATSCGLTENTCSKTQTVNFPLEGGVCNTVANDFYCFSFCRTSVACSGTDVSGCTGRTHAYYTSGSLVSCNDATYTVVCSCSVAGVTYNSEILQTPTCLG